jgi:imidazolonepropionase-like amidohydrolase
VASDNEAQTILDELRATLAQLQKAGVPVKLSADTQNKPVVWIGLGGVKVEHGALVFDSAALMELKA